MEEVQDRKKVDAKYKVTDQLHYIWNLYIIYYLSLHKDIFFLFFHHEGKENF